MERLIALSLFIIPFISIQSQDIRELKGALAFAVMLVIGLLAFYRGQIKPFGNKWALILVGFVWLNVMMSPSSGLKFAGMELMQFWSWKPFCYLLVYFIGIVAISSQEKINAKYIINMMVWAGFIMSLLVIIQLFSLDQFFRSTGQPHEQWKIGGTLGHPTFVSAFIAMIVPLAFYAKKKYMAYTLIIAVLITQSQVAIGAMALSLAFYFGCRGKKQLLRVAVCLVALSIGVVALSYAKPGYVTSSGRFDEWKKIVKMVNTSIRPNEGVEKYGKYPVTGLGVGSFYYTYHVLRSQEGEPCKMYQAHNEYLEWFYNCGIIGLILLMMAIGVVYKRNFNRNGYRTALLSSFTCVALSAGGMFVWQLGATMFYSAVILGLLHNSHNEIGD